MFSDHREAKEMLRTGHKTLRRAASYPKIGLVHFCMVVRKSVPSLAYFTAEWAWDGPAHVHLDMPPHLILLLHHLLTLKTLVP